MSALLVIPQVRAVAGGVLASSAVLAPRDRVREPADDRELRRRDPDRDQPAPAAGRRGRGAGTRGVVEEIGLSYTWIRTRDNDRLVVPNERLASETIRNSTIRSSKTFAEATVQVPADARLREVVQPLGADGDEVYVTDLVGENATVVVRKRVSGESAADRVSSDLRLRDRRAPGEGRAVTPRRRRDDFDLILAHRGRKRKRADRIKRRRRAGVVAATSSSRSPRSPPPSGLGAGTALSASCDLNTLRPVEIGQNSFVYAYDGSLLGSIPAERNREPVSTPNMSPWLPKSTTAIEDRRFWEHGGVDYVGIARAAWKDLTAGKVVEGGSTITQQLVRNLYTGQEQTFTRKIKEACLAIKLASKWPKPKILNEYLNTVYYGNHAYGVEAASQTYFSKHASQLTLLESALLAGLPQAPSVYDPFHNPQAALDRRDEVLRALLANNDITLAQYHQAIRSNSLGLKPGRIYTHIRQPYFFSYVIDELERQYGANTVREGGLKVYTTIDPRLQRPANKAIRDILPYRTDPASAVVSVEPGTGAIRAMTAVVRQHGQPVQSRRAIRAPGRLDVQDLRARLGDRAGRRPRHDLLHVGAVHLLDRAVVPAAVGGAHLRRRPTPAPSP